MSPSDRVSLGAAAVVSPSMAAEWLPMGRAVAMAFLRSHGLIRTVSVPDGRKQRSVEVVVWGDVLDAIRGIRATVRAPLPYIDPED